MTHLTLITREHWKRMLWKNGAGVTMEIAITPAGSSLEARDFDWRLSSARIEKECRFSPFPTYDRWLTVLSGAGLMLNGRKLRPFETFRFTGEEVIECQPIADAVDDLGIIFKRDLFQCFMHVVEVSAPMSLTLNAPLAFLRPLSDGVRVADIDVSVGDFLKVESLPSVDVTAMNYPARLLTIDISRRPSR